jgi:hypothetical protein
VPTDTRLRAPSHVPPREAVSFARKRPGSLYAGKSVGSFLPGLTHKAFEKYGFSAATLITDWPAIVGRELAAVTAPERLKWPRAVEHAEDDTNANAGKGRPGATLVLRADGSQALAVQYGARQIIERINAYFGYAAVAELRLVQAPVDPAPGLARPANRPAAQPLTHEVASQVASVADAGLRDALARLGAGVRTGR